MPINREPDFVDPDHVSEESRVRRAPLDQDDAYELADHEFTLVADDAADDSRGWPYDEHTAPWSTLPPLPAWATKARALLEPPTLPRPLNEETPTLVEEGEHVSATGMRALRTEITVLLREAHARSEQIEQLERSLANAVQARADAERTSGAQTAALQGRVEGQTRRILELEETLRALEAERDARAAEVESERRAIQVERDARAVDIEALRQLKATHEAQTIEHEAKVRERKAAHEAQLRELRAQHAARVTELEHEVRALKAMQEVRTAAIEELRERKAEQESQVAELENELREVKKSHKARVAKHEAELRELKDEQHASAVALAELRARKVEQEERAAKLADELQQLRAADEQRTAAFEAERREYEAARGVRAAELAELGELREAQEARAAELDALSELNTAQEQQIADLEAELHAEQVAQQARAAELEQLRVRSADYDALAAELDQLRVRTADYDALAAELEQSRVRTADYDARTAELEDLRARTAAHEEQKAELDRLRELAAMRAEPNPSFDQLRELAAIRDAQAAELQQLRELGASFEAQSAELRHLRELSASFEAQTEELQQLRELRATHEAQAAELQQLRQRSANYEAHNTELARVRLLCATHEARAAELEDEVRAMRAFRHVRASALGVSGAELVDPSDFATHVASDSDTDLETTVEWITNAAPSVEVTIEVDANDEEEELPECRAPVPSLDADDDERLAAAAQASEFVVEIERAPALHAVETAGEDATAGDSSSTEAPCDGHFVARPDSEDLAAASDDSEITAEIVPRRHSEEFTATLLPNPETTLEIDPDHDLFDLEAELPPLTIPAPAAIGGKRKPPAKRRAPTKRDDFQQIEGVGKRLEQRLYAKGIRTYAQLAALRPAELTRLAKQIGVTPERIQREAWVAQAKRLRKSATTRKRAAASVPRKPKRARA